jgi:hypothetical protein
MTADARTRGAAMTPASARTLAEVRAELSRLLRYDDESIVHDAWIRQRYDLGAAASYAPARTAAVATAWHEAGHVVAALAAGAKFSSASIRHGRDSQGRVHKVTGGGEDAFVIDAAGQLAEQLRDWSLRPDDDQLRAWLAAWRDDGGDARPAGALRRGPGPRLAVLRAGPDPAAAADQAGSPGPARPPTAPAVSGGGRDRRLSGLTEPLVPGGEAGE